MGMFTYFKYFTAVYRFLTLSDHHTDQEQTMNVVLTFLHSMWRYRPTFTSEFALILVVLMLGFFCYTMINKIHTTTPKAPSSYNHDTNINVWLNQVEDYLDVNKIKSDKQRQETLLLRLDRTNRLALQKLIDNKTIKSYQELQDHVKSLYNNDIQTTRDHVLNFIQRQQQPNVKCIFEQNSQTWNFHLRAESGLGQFRD